VPGSHTPDIVVVGTGPVGLIAAISLARAGRPVTLIGPRANRNDARTTALMVPSLSYLDGLGVGEAIYTAAAPLRVMRIVDATRRLIRSPVVTFHASEIGEAYFGLNIPNSALNAVLEQQVLETPGIDWAEDLVSRWRVVDDAAIATLSGGEEIGAKLVVAADGRLSPARDVAGITTSQHAYPQSALVVTFDHERSHGSISTEFHTETGPFTQVPLPGDRSSLVWVVEPATAAVLAALDRETLSMRIEERMQSMLGKISANTDCQVYPLSVTRAGSFGRNRVALVGEAAHVFPPIGAQGLNLGIRDVEQLCGILSGISGDPGAPQVLTLYDAKRRPDILARTTAVSLLNRSLLSDMLPAQMLRSAGLAMLDRFTPLRSLFMREGLNPGSGVASMLAAATQRPARR